MGRNTERQPETEGQNDKSRLWEIGEMRVRDRLGMMGAERNKTLLWENRSRERDRGTGWRR